MQNHWLTWGPPPYIPIAGYFGINKKGKKPGDSHPLDPEGGTGDLNELLRMFPGGVIQ